MPKKPLLPNSSKSGAAAPGTASHGDIPLKSSTGPKMMTSAAPVFVSSSARGNCVSNVTLFGRASSSKTRVVWFSLHTLRCER